MKKSTQTEDFITEKKEKIEESDTNSDEFPEEREYEKISKKIIEEEINQTDILSVEQDATEEEETLKSQSDPKNKKVLEVDLKS